MKKYFLELLQNLDKLCGLKQYEKLYQLENRNQEIDTLLDILCRVSAQFPYIPEEKQQNIISEAVITDLEFQGLNARIIYKWLNMKKDTYFQEISHIPSEIDSVPLTGEARDARLKEWQQALNSLPCLNYKPPAFEKVREISTTSESGYKPNHEAAEKHAKHIRWIQAMYNPDTQKTRTIDEGFQDEETWNLVNP